MSPIGFYLPKGWLDTNSIETEINETKMFAQIKSLVSTSLSECVQDGKAIKRMRASNCLDNQGIVH